MSDIKRTVETIEHKALEKKGEIKGRMKQLKQDREARSLNEQ